MSRGASLGEVHFDGYLSAMPSIFPDNCAETVQNPQNRPKCAAWNGGSLVFKMRYGRVPAGPSLQPS